VLAWESYYETGPVDFRTEMIEVLTRIGNAITQVRQDRRAYGG
jgi:hypothetical protein